MSQADPIQPSLRLPAAIEAVLAGDPPRATRFIVTLYGDVVEPRGGVLGMATLIEVCAAHGISETLVRTAVSRLVAAGKLSGERAGRRSFYRLTPAARTEFTAAARVLFAPPPAPEGWLLAPVAPDLPADPDLPGWARLAEGVLFGPDRPDLPRPPGLLLGATVLAGVADLPALAARLWDLAGIAGDYRAFLARFAPVHAALGDPDIRPDGATCLAIRLLLVDQYRAVVLRDPRLPATALPEDWPGRAARALFVTLYRRLAGPADSHVGRSFRDTAGLLPSTSEATALRLDRLALEQGSLEF